MPLGRITTDGRVFLTEVAGNEDNWGHLCVGPCSLGFAERQAVKDEKIKNAVILCGVGSVSSYRVHAAGNTTLPATLAYGELAVPMDLIALDGYVLRGRIDAHITMTDDRHAFGGHPHEGTKVFTFVSSLRLGVLEDNVDLSRFNDSSW
jgi:hypothetical protein